MNDMVGNLRKRISRLTAYIFMKVSDDNSSIQSSPWQRDHSWKQTTPRRNLSKEMSFYYWRPRGTIGVLRNNHQQQQQQQQKKKKSKKCRRPYSSTPEPQTDVRNSGRTKVCNNHVNKKKPSLVVIVQSLSEKNAAAGTPPRAEVVVSPRKR